MHVGSAGKKSRTGFRNKKLAEGPKGTTVCRAKGVNLTPAPAQATASVDIDIIELIDMT
jgi:hypothetical protein